MLDGSINSPTGVMYDVLVKVDKIIFSSDFVVLDCKIDVQVPIILDMPLFST